MPHRVGKRGRCAFIFLGLSARLPAATTLTFFYWCAFGMFSTKKDELICCFAERFRSLECSACLLGSIREGKGSDRSDPLITKHIGVTVTLPLYAPHPGFVGRIPRAKTANEHECHRKTMILTLSVHSSRRSPPLPFLSPTLLGSAGAYAEGGSQGSRQPPGPRARHRRSQDCRERCRRLVRRGRRD